MKSIIISSDSSGSGKTTVTIGIMKALTERGFTVQGYKVGPDYIDTAFHEKITRIPSRNLDIFLMGEEGVRASYSRGNGDIGIVEGVMGLYDGKGIGTKYSTAHVSKLLNLPVILVMNPKGKSTTICAEINGMIDFESVNIVGVILNNVSKSYYNLIKVAINKNCNVEVFGFIPKDNRVSLKSRHLGLIQSSEVTDLDSRVDILGKLIVENIDIDRMLEYFKETQDYEDRFHLKSKDMKIAVAYDEAFSFYYKENLELLNELGEIIFFSPIHDEKLPENIDFLYLGGGYPEVFIEVLSKNKTMIWDIREKLNSGLRCYAECGGLMYLMDEIQNVKGDKSFDMVGFFKGKVFMSDKLHNFGYSSVEVVKYNQLLKSGIKINCHEFHKSYIRSMENRVYEVTKKMYDGSEKKWECGYYKNNTLAAYAHVHFFGNMDFIKNIVNYNSGGKL
ncbi:cobyrinate a,c-diamide synthase [Clostridium tyrobutyricum]|jgi:cobyrinic acid a,c-diamide synthase|uniref:cobyrinate a,c-diamide synthase n=1 Tax=Clostridium tyrobutyricum TaxID=1519 RepID=UPI001C385D8F|nr:cobyrinate a,c-diamide synthase [Clostridium tyrobutyricum]MBV4425340.1 cobyrinate a,c-diamide synthase [Clostridium tyrobutyricum]